MAPSGIMMQGSPGLPAHTGTMGGTGFLSGKVSLKRVDPTEVGFHNRVDRHVVMVDIYT